jgi:hypothetical protein
MSIHVFRTRVDSAESPRAMDVTHEELENYYVTPEDAMAGPNGRKISFQEAINMFQV